MELDKFPAEILGKSQKIPTHIYSEVNIHSAYSMWIFAIWIVNAN